MYYSSSPVSACRQKHFCSLPSQLLSHNDICTVIASCFAYPHRTLKKSTFHLQHGLGKESTVKSVILLRLYDLGLYIYILNLQCSNTILILISNKFSKKNFKLQDERSPKRKKELTQTKPLKNPCSSSIRKPNYEEKDVQCKKFTGIEHSRLSLNMGSTWRT